MLSVPSAKQGGYLTVVESREIKGLQAASRVRGLGVGTGYQACRPGEADLS